MPLAGWVLLGAIAAAAGVWQAILHRYTHGPSHCMGCGKCDETGVCILTGEPVRGKRK